MAVEGLKGKICREGKGLEAENSGRKRKSSMDLWKNLTKGKSSVKKSYGSRWTSAGERKMRKMSGQSARAVGRNFKEKLLG